MYINNCPFGEKLAQSGHPDKGRPEAGANPTIASYNASVAEIYNTTRGLASF
jgi:hypothetical protein